MVSGSQAAQPSLQDCSQLHASLLRKLRVQREGGPKPAKAGQGVNVPALHVVSIVCTAPFRLQQQNSLVTKRDSTN